MEALGRKDHDALVLRFFENKNFAEVGAAFGASEDNARMRVNRALGKLRKFFTKRGVTPRQRRLPGRFPPTPFKPRRWAWRKQFLPSQWRKGRRLPSQP